MLKQLFAIFNKDTLMDKAFSRSYEMLAITKDMFNAARKSLREKENNSIEIDIYDKDIEVNRFEREVRRNIFSHLTVAGGDEIYSALVLASIVIDIERIGDYTKNMVDLAKQHPAKLSGGIFEEDLARVEKGVADTFERVPVQFEKSDVKDAEAVLKEYRWINQLCDQHVNDYINEVDKEISSGDAVTLAMYFRYLKRINSHLRNIATSVVNPFDHIGFTHKLSKQQQEEDD